MASSSNHFAPQNLSLSYIPVTQTGGIVVCNGNIVCIMQQPTIQSPATLIFPPNTSPLPPSVTSVSPVVMNVSDSSVSCSMSPKIEPTTRIPHCNRVMHSQQNQSKENMTNSNNIAVKTVPNRANARNDSTGKDPNSAPGLKTITQSTMKRGRHIAPTQKPFVCETCGKGYKYRCNYRSHIKIHTDQAFVCKYCNKRFGRKSNFNEHVRIHTGEAPYKCQFCKRTFKQHHGWKDHLRVHTGEKPYLCKVCGKRFTVGHNLNVHMRIHTGERPYGCDICHKSYRQKSAYNSHMKHVHAHHKK